MFFSYWIAMMIPILMGPFHSHRTYARVFERERTRIAIDNGAILVGEADRGWLTWLERENAQLQAWDAAHHPSHFCKFSPVPPTAAACLSADKFWEAAILARHARARAEVQLRWSLASARARRELTRLAVNNGIVGRATVPALRAKRCPICQGTLGWEVTRMPSTPIAGGRNPHQNARVTLLRNGTGFQYEISE